MFIQDAPPRRPPVAAGPVPATPDETPTVIPAPASPHPARGIVTADRAATISALRFLMDVFDPEIGRL